MNNRARWWRRWLPIDIDPRRPAGIPSTDEEHDAAICLAHAWLIPWLQARRGADQVRALPAAGSDAERVAIGLLGDLLAHSERELLLETGLVMERGELGVWLLGASGALLVRSGGRVDCWCVRVGDASDLPPADRAAHLLLGLREDELGFAKVANLSFSGACWRVRALEMPSLRLDRRKASACCSSCNTSSGRKRP